MSTPLERVQVQLLDNLLDSIPKTWRAEFAEDWADELRVAVVNTTADWEVSVARDRRRKWRVYVPRDDS